jgi:uncharacterized membrane protein
MAARSWHATNLTIPSQAFSYSGHPVWVITDRPGQGKLEREGHAAVVTKDTGGNVHVNKDETATRHGAWGGAAAGAVVGLLFPPSILVTAAVGAAVGAVGGHLWRGMSRADVKEFGDIIDDGQAALVIVGESTVEQAVNKAALKAEKRIAKQLNVSVKDVDQAVQEAAGELS